MKTKRKIVWNTINWKKIQLRVWRIKTKIYYCSLKGKQISDHKIAKNPN